MAGETNDADVVAEVLAAELGTDVHVAGHVEDFFFHFQVSETVGGFASVGGKSVEVAGAGVLCGLESVFSGGTTDNDAKVVGRAGGGAEAADLAFQEVHHGFVVKDGFGLLEEVALVSGAAAFSHEEEVVVAVRFRLGVSIEFDLRGEVAAGVLFLVHGQWCVLGVAQVVLGVGVVDAARESTLVGTFGKDVLAAFALDNGGASVLAHGEGSLRGDDGVL